MYPGTFSLAIVTGIWTDERTVELEEEVIPKNGKRRSKGRMRS
jgi:hypothetical protein